MEVLNSLTVAELTVRLAAAEEALARKEKTIQDLTLRLQQATERSAVSEHGDDAALLQQVVARKTLELEQSEERFAGAFELAPIGVALVELDGRWLKVNRALCQVVGYSEAELLKLTFQEITYPPDLKSDLDMLCQLLSGKISTYQVEKRYVHAQGHLVSVLLNVSLARDRSGQPLYFIAQIQDITDRKLVEAGLRASEEKLRGIFEHSAQVFYSHTVDGQLTYVSPQAKDFFDCSVAEAQQLWTSFLTDNPVNAEGIELTRAAVETGKPQRPYELELRSKLGRRVWVEVHESPQVVDGKTVAIVGALTDITARKCVEARHRADEERYLRQRDALIDFAGGLNDGDILSTLQQLTETAAKTMKVDRVSVWQYNVDRTSICCIDLYELAANRHTAGAELKAADYPVYFQALEASNVIAANDINQDSRTSEFLEHYLGPLGITSMLDAPIHLGTSREGVLCHEHIGPQRVWTSDEQTFAVAMANRASLALEASKRKEAEEELRSALARLEQMLAYSPAVTYRLKLVGALYIPVGVSENITRVTGYTQEEVFETGWWLRHIHPEYRDRANANGSGTFSSEDTSRAEYQFRHKSGAYHWIEDHRRVLRDAAGHPQGIVGVWIDITERKHAEQLERQSEERYRSLIENARDAIFTIASDGTFTSLNPAAESMVGITRAEWLGRPFAPFVHPDDLVQAMSMIQRILKDEQVPVHEWRAHPALNRPAVMEMTLTGQKDENGKVIGVLGIGRDLTERRSAEQAMRLQMVALEAAANGLVISDVHGTIQWVNPAFTRLTGFSAAEAIGQNPRMFKSGRQDELFYSDLWQTISGGGIWKGELINRRKNGELYHEEMSITPVRDTTGKITNFVAIKQDISDRKGAEEELRRKTALLEAQVDASLDGILMVDGRGQQLLKNKRFFEVWKIPQEIADQSDDSLTLQYATSQTKNPKQFLEKVVYLYAHPYEISRDEIELIDGRFLDRYSAPVRDQRGRHYGRIWTFRDVTERKQAEASLQDLHRQLLEASRQSGMAEIASNVLHNVGNVLNSINVAASVATDKVLDFKVEALERLGVMLAEQADLGAFFSTDPRAAAVPRFLQGVAQRLQSDRATVLSELDGLRHHIEHVNEIVATQQTYAKACGVMEVLPLVDLIEDALRLNVGSIERHGMQVMRDFADVPPVLVDRHKLLLILVNLIRNAKFALDDGAPAEKRLVLRLAPNGADHAEITVHDNGIGIPPENLARVFEHGFTTRKDGHGFGLHSSANAAQEMGGTLMAKSDGHGLGATFTLVLPVHPESSNP